MTGHVFREHQLTAYCQHCGQPVPQNFKKIDGVTLLPDRLVRGENNIVLTPRMHGIMEQFLKAYPNVLPRELLFERVWDIDVNDIKIVDVYICKLNKKLPVLGMKLKTAWGVGHRLEIV